MVIQTRIFIFKLGKDVHLYHNLELLAFFLVLFSIVFAQLWTHRMYFYVLEITFPCKLPNTCRNKVTSAGNSHQEYTQPLLFY